ncbi:stage III sporulation protein AF [bacterium 1xD42-67]|nr:stage III sporulation protein AF [bacterium 1xD42-67]
MIGAVRSWLLAVTAVSLLCALAGALMPKGPVERVGRLVCGLVMLAAVLSPLAGPDLGEGQRWLEDYLASVDQREAELTQEVDDQMKTIIEGEYAAYIVDKAAQLGLTCTAQVECQADGDGLLLPVRTQVSGPLSEAGRAQLAQAIQEDLGVPPEGQTYIEEGAP